MKYLWLLVIPFLLGLTAIKDTHRTDGDVDTEFRNIYMFGDDKKITITEILPTTGSLKESEKVIYSTSGAASYLFFNIKGATCSIRITNMLITETLPTPETLRQNESIIYYTDTPSAGLFFNIKNTTWSVQLSS